MPRSIAPQRFSPLCVRDGFQSEVDVVDEVVASVRNVLSGHVDAGVSGVPFCAIAGVLLSYDFVYTFPTAEGPHPSENNLSLVPLLVRKFRYAHRGQLMSEFSYSVPAHLVTAAFRLQLKERDDKKAQLASACGFSLEISENTACLERVML